MAVEVIWKLNYFAVVHDEGIWVGFFSFLQNQYRLVIVNQSNTWVQGYLSNYWPDFQKFWVNVHGTRIMTPNNSNDPLMLLLVYCSNFQLTNSLFCNKVFWQVMVRTTWYSRYFVKHHHLLNEIWIYNEEIAMEFIKDTQITPFWMLHDLCFL